MEFSIGKECVILIDGMADNAIASLRALKDGETSDRSGRERLFVLPILILIKRRVPAEQRPLETCQRLLNLLEGDGSWPEGLSKLGLIGGVFANLRDRNLVLLIHLHRIPNRSGGLLLQTLRAAIPELQGRIRRVQ